MVKPNKVYYSIYSIPFLASGKFLSKKTNFTGVRESIKLGLNVMGKSLHEFILYLNSPNSPGSYRESTY